MSGSVIVAQFTQGEILIPGVLNMAPWDLAQQAADLVAAHLSQLDDQYELKGQVAVHRTATVHPSVTGDGPVIVGPGSNVGPNAHLRAGVYLGTNVRVGPGCEVKSSWVLDNSALAHLNYVGNSVIGQQVNIEAGAVLANHFNEREDKRITVTHQGQSTDTGVEKFGAMVGDGVRIGANAVTSPGTLLARNTVVGRLELVDQS